MSTRPPPSLSGQLGADDDLIVCRCEEVRLSDLIAAMAQGDDAPEMLKRATRITMGACQGRVCRPIYRAFWRSARGGAAALAGAALSAPAPHVGVDGDSRASLPMHSGFDLPGSRPPVRPIRVSDLADLEPPEEEATPSQGNR